MDTNDRATATVLYPALTTLREGWVQKETTEQTLREIETRLATARQIVVHEVRVRVGAFGLSWDELRRIVCDDALSGA